MKILRTILLGIFVVAALAYLNVIIPRPQTSEARTYNEDHHILAQEFPCNTGSCPSRSNVIKMVVDETPECSTGSLSSLAGYKGKASFQVENSNAQYKIHVVWGTYFCPNATTGSCTSGQILDSQDIFVNPGQWVATYSPARNESNLTCGKVQTDMSFQAYRKVGSEWVLNLSYGSLSNPGESNATYTYCNTNKVCPAPTHKACVNNACSVVASSGSDTCNTNADCQIQTHHACQDNACKVVAGPGADTCSTDSQCQTPPPHLIVKKHVINDDNGTKSAQDFTIFVKDTTTDQIISQTAGNENGTTITLPLGVQYSVYEGDHTGYDETSSGDCSGMVPAGTTKTCTLINNDIANATHKACVSNACTVVNGAGSDSCKQDSDCTTPTHHACQSQACVLVNGSGSDSCSQDSDCHIDTCSGTNCGNINITVEQHQQQQQQQAVLGASVAPAVNATSLPSTGSGAEVLLGLFGLLPLGLKLRKFV